MEADIHHSESHNDTKLLEGLCIVLSAAQFLYDTEAMPKRTSKLLIEATHDAAVRVLQNRFGRTLSKQIADRANQVIEEVRDAPSSVKF